MKTIIQDAITEQYYCVEQTGIDHNGAAFAQAFDFPFWSDDINDAYDFESPVWAKNELVMNDLTCDGSRTPVIVNP